MFKAVPTFRSMNIWRRSDRERLFEQLEELRDIANSVRSIQGGGIAEVTHSPSGVLVSVLAATEAGETAATGTASVAVDWRINGTDFQLDERVLTAAGLSLATAENWVTKATGGTCAPT